MPKLPDRRELIGTNVTARKTYGTPAALTAGKEYGVGMLLAFILVWELEIYHYVGLK